MTGHTATVASVACQESDPQIISGSMDSTVRLWDIVAGKTMTQLTHHHKSVRSLAVHPTEFSFASASAGSGNLKKWALPNAEFGKCRIHAHVLRVCTDVRYIAMLLVHNFSGNEGQIINTCAVQSDGVFFSGGEFTDSLQHDTLRRQTYRFLPQPTTGP